MAQLVIAAAGAAIGGALAPVGFTFLGLKGAALGWMAGSMLGSMLAPTQRSAGPRLEELRVIGTEYGNGIAWVAGAPRVAGDLIWASDRREIATTEEVGKGGGGSEYTTYTYELDALYLLADQPDAIVTRCWDNGKLIWTNLASADDASRLASEQTTKWRRITVYNGEDTQQPDPTYEAAVTHAPAYTRRLCVFIEGLQLGSSGTLPNLTFEVASFGDTNPNFVRRSEVADTGRQFADSHSDGLGRPAILSITPSVRVATLTDSGTEVYRFDLDGTPDGTDVRASGEDYPSVAYAASTYENTSTPVGILDGSPVRVANHARVLGSDPLIQHIRAGHKTGLEWITNVSADLSDCLPDGRWLGDTMPCSDGVHMMVFTGPTTAYSGAAVLDRWHIIKKGSGGDGVLVSEGDIDPPRSWLAYGSSAVNYMAAMLEDDLLHVWYAFGAGEGTVNMLKIEPDGVLRPRSSMRFALLQYGFTRTSIWAEGSFCVVVSRQSYQAFRRSGDVIGEVPLQDVVEALCDRATMPAGAYDASALAAITQPVRALAVTSGSTRQALEILQTSHGFDAYVTDKLYFVPRGGAPALTVDVDDLAAGDGNALDEPFALTVNADLEMPSRIAVVFKNMIADQINGTEHSDRGPTGQDSIQTMQLAIGMTPSEAKGVADAMVRDAYAARITSQLSLPLTYTHLTPTDVIQVPGSDGTVYRMRITRRSDSGGIMQLDVVGDDGEVVIEPMATSDDYAEQTAVQSPAGTEFYALDIPTLRDADSSPGFYVAAKGTGPLWAGCVIQSSFDGVTFQTVAQINEPAVMGLTTSALSAWAGGDLFDTINTVTVNVGDGQLSSATRDAVIADRTVNAALIGAEIVRFTTATLLSAAPNIYRLSGLLRGQRGTEAFTGHASDERFVLLATSSGIRRVSHAASELRKTRQLKAITILTSEQSAAVPFYNSGVSSLPLAPVSIRATRQSNGDILFSWSNRSRLSTSFVGPSGSLVPLGEESEEYNITVFADGSYSGAPSLAKVVYGARYALFSYIEQVNTAVPFAAGFYYVEVKQKGIAGNGYAGRATLRIPVFNYVVPGVAFEPANGPGATDGFRIRLYANSAYVDDILLILPLTGTPGATTFTDTGPLTRTVTTIGSVEVEPTAIAPYGSTSAQFLHDGAVAPSGLSLGAVSSLPEYADFNSGSWTVQGWIRVDADVAQYVPIFSIEQQQSDGRIIGICLCLSTYGGSSTASYKFNDRLVVAQINLDTAPAIPHGTAFHFAFVCENGKHRAFINGRNGYQSLQGSQYINYFYDGGTILSDSLVKVASSLVMGGLRGRMQGLSIHRVALYKDDFVPPVSAVTYP